LKTDTGTWVGKIGEITGREDGTGVANIISSEGGPCDVACPFVPTQGPSQQVQGHLISLEPTAGTVVPTTAIVSSGSRAYVVTEGGSEVGVKVVASSRGDSVVTGVSSGVKVRVDARGQP